MLSPPSQPRRGSPPPTNSCTVAGARHAGNGLTATESEIAGLIAAGRSNQEIASQLFIAVSTVEAHQTRIYRKLDLRGRTQLTRWVHVAA